MTARPGTAEQSVACAINRAAAGRPVPGNKVDLLIDGPDTYAAMHRWAEQNGFELGGAPWESYITDPAEHPDPANWRTEIYWPLK